MTSITVLGAGAMGARMARNFSNAGHEVTVWNRTPDTAQVLADTHGLSTAPTPREAVQGADVVVSMLTNDQASRDVWLNTTNGAMTAMASNAVAIESSTITPSMARELAQAAVHLGVDFLEAPIIGSRPQADAGALFCLIGGDEDVLDRVRPVIEVNAAGIRHVGATGNASTMKLAINALFGIQVAAYGEIAGLLARSEVDTDTAIDILIGLPITSPGLQRVVGLYADRNFAPNFPIRLVAKDFGYLTAVADTLDVAAPITGAAFTVYSDAANGPERELDIAGIASRYLPD